MDQRKLMDNANTITDMAKTQNTVYEIVSDMSSRQDVLEEKITHLEDKIKAVQVNTPISNSPFFSTLPCLTWDLSQLFLNLKLKLAGKWTRQNLNATWQLSSLVISLRLIQEQIESLPETLARCLSQHQERIEQRRNFLHPDTAALLSATSTGGLQTQPPPTIGSPLFPHSR